MNINRKYLLTLIQKLMPGTSSKEEVEQSGCVIFIDGRGVTFNDDIGVSCAVPELAALPKCAIPAAPLLALLKRLSDEEVDFSVNEGSLVVATKRAKATLRVEAEITAPLDELKIPDGSSKIPDGFIDAIVQTSFSASDDHARPVLTCIHLHPQHIQTCDRYRMTRVVLDTPKGLPPDGVLLPATVARLLPSYSPHRFAAKGGWMHFFNKDDVCLSVRLYQGKFPDLDALLVPEDKGAHVVFGDGAKEALERAGVFTQTEFEQDEHIEIQVASGKAVLRGKGEHGTYRERVSVEYKGDEFDFRVNPRFFSTMLERQSKITVHERNIRVVIGPLTHVVSRIAAPAAASDKGGDEDV